MMDIKMEAAGIEPASENVPSENLHTCQVPILSYSDLKEPAIQSEHQPVEFRPLPPGQQQGVIQSKVTLFNQTTGELIKDRLLVKQNVLIDSQQMVVFIVFKCLVY